MARTIQEITDDIKRDFVSDGTLINAYGLMEGKSFDKQFSKVSVEAILIYVFASSAWLLEQMWGAFKAETEKRISQAYVTSLSWYYHKALEFQKGDSLIFDEKSYSFGYQVQDEEKRVVKNVAVRQMTDEGVTKLKVYFSDVDKNPLTGDVRVSFETYMRQICAAGTHYFFVSQSPDELRVHLHIYYDPLVIDSSGTRISGEGKPVEETIIKYLDSIEYGGVFYASKLVDAIQATLGIKDVTLDGTTWKGDMQDRRRIDSESGAFRYVIQDADITYMID